MAKPGGQQNPKAEILFLYGKPKKDNDRYLIPVVIKTVKGGQSLGNQIVKIISEGKEIHVITTEANGEKIDNIAVKGEPGKTVELTAILSGPDHAEKPLTILIPDGETGKTQKHISGYAEIKEHGQSGNYRISIQVLNKDAKPYEANFVIIESLSPTQISILPQTTQTQAVAGISEPLRDKTNTNGFTTVMINRFNDKRRKINVRIEGTDIDRELILGGPKQPFWRSRPNMDEGFRGNLFRTNNQT